MKKDDSYTGHKLARQLGAAAIHAGLCSVHAEGHYQFNKAVFLSVESDDPRFAGHLGDIYDPSKPIGRVSEKIFLPRRYQDRPLEPAEIASLHSSGMRLRCIANWGLMAPLMARFSANIYYQSKETDWVRQSAMGLDTASITGAVSSGLMFNVAQQMAYRWPSAKTEALLQTSWKMNMVGSGLQMGAGVFRIGVEYNEYLQTGRMNNSTMTYAALDIFGGAGGVAISKYILDDAAHVTRPRVNGVTPKTHTLLGSTQPPPRMQWGLRVVNGLGSVVGLAVNSFNIYKTRTSNNLATSEKNRRYLSGALGILGAVMMGGSAMMVGTALAPYAGLLLAGSFLVLIGQTLYDYFG